MVAVQDLDAVGGRDVAGGDDAGAGGADLEPLRPLDFHLHRDALEVQHDVGDVLADARRRDENSCSTPSICTAGDRRALQRGQQHPAQRVAERQAEAALQRLGDGGGLAVRIGARP